MTYSAGNGKNAANGGLESDAGLPTSELAARLRLVVMRLQRRLRAQAGDGLTATMTSALVSIERHGPLTLGRLAEIERITRPSITRIAAALEQAGLVSRQVDAVDRRVAHLSITSQGTRLLRRVRTRKTAYLARRLSTLEEADLAVLRDALPVLERLLEAEQ